MAEERNIKNIVGFTLGIPSMCFLSALLMALFFNLPNKWIGVLLAGYVFATVVIITKNIKMGLLFLIIMDIPITLDVRLIPGGEGSLIGGIFLSLTDVSIFSLIIHRLLSRPDEQTKVALFSKASFPALLFVCANILSIMVTSDNMWTLFGIVVAGKLFLLFFVVANSISSKTEIKHIMSFLLITFFIQSLMYIIMSYAQIDFDVVGVAQVSTGSRIRGFLGQANTAGAYFSSGLIITMGSYFAQRKAFNRILIGILFSVEMCALILTLTRGGWLSFVICGLIFSIIGINKKWIKWRSLLIFLITPVLLACFYSNSVFERITGGDKGATQDRIIANRAAIEIIKGQPFLGVGANTIKSRIKIYKEKWEMGYLKLHNQYLQVWAETGLIGILSFVWFLFVVFKQGFKSISSSVAVDSGISAGIVMGLFAICVSMMVDSTSGGAVLNSLWFLSGLITGIEKLS